MLGAHCRLQLFIFWQVLKEFTAIGLTLTMTKANNSNLKTYGKLPGSKAEGKTCLE